MAEPRPGAALAAALQQTAQQLAEEQAMANKVVAPGSHGSHASNAQFAAQLRRLEQQIELERRQVERRLDKMERRIEEVASLNTSTGRWAELQGHVDGLEESLQNLIRGRIEPPARSHGANGCSQVHGGSPASWGRVSELDDQVLQISHRLLRLEHSLQGESGDIERPQPQEMLKFKSEVQEVLGHMESFKGWEEQMVMLEDQVGGMGRRLEDVTQDLQEILETRAAEDLVENLEERRWRLAMSAKQMTSGAAEGELQQELSTISEDLTSLFMRVEQSEVGLYSLADAVSRICEELGHLRSAPSQRSAAVTQPVPGFAGASVVADAPC